jgi:hypothetical protein
MSLRPNRSKTFSSRLKRRRTKSFAFRRCFTRMPKNREIAKRPLKKRGKRSGTSLQAYASRSIMIK